MTNPISDAFAFLTASTGDFNALGLWKYLPLLLFYALLAGSLWLAVVNWRDDPAQRKGTALWLWVARLLIGCMWFQGTLWKLPFGHQNGLWYWTQQMAGRAAFEIHRAFVTDVILPNFDVVNPLVYLASYFSGGLVGSAVLGQIFDRLGWPACVLGVGLALAAAALLATQLRGALK